jgi:hypothetical protein
MGLGINDCFKLSTNDKKLRSQMLMNVLTPIGNNLLDEKGNPKSWNRYWKDVGSAYSNALNFKPKDKNFTTGLAWQGIGDTGAHMGRSFFYASIATGKGGNADTGMLSTLPGYFGFFEAFHETSERCSVSDFVADTWGAALGSGWASLGWWNPAAKTANFLY